MFKAFSTWMKQNPIPAFFILTFFIAWGIWLPIGFLVPKAFLIVIIPGAWAPTLASVYLTWLTDGKEGVRQFLKRVIHWRVGIQWYLVCLFGIAVIAFTAQGLNARLLGGSPISVILPPGVPEEQWLIAVLIVFLVNLLVSVPIAEDIGWRGYALPKLREKLDAFSASLVIGLIWVVWHLPFFWFPEGKSAVGGIPFLWFGLMTLAWSVLFAWVYVNTESILMPILFHAAVNTTLGTLGVLGQSTGDITPVILNTVLTWLMVGIVLYFTGRDLLVNNKKPSLM